MGLFKCIYKGHFMKRCQYPIHHGTLETCLINDVENIVGFRGLKESFFLIIPICFTAVKKCARSFCR